MNTNELKQLEEQLDQLLKIRTNEKLLNDRKVDILITIMKVEDRLVVASIDVDDIYSIKVDVEGLKIKVTYEDEDDYREIKTTKIEEYNVKECRVDFDVTFRYGA